MISPFRAFLAVLAVLVAFVASPAVAGPHARPVVVELYTSQGCSSCPPADALLGQLARRPDVIAISLPITYWDMLGWKDTLASDANTRRQKAYAAAMGHGGVYTPQIIVDGMLDVVGSRVASVEAAIAERRASIYGAASIAIARTEAARAEAAARADIARAMARAARADAAGARAIAASLPAMPPAPPPPPMPPLPPAPPAYPAGWADPVVPVAVTQTSREMHVEIGAVPGAHNATVWLFHLRSSVSVDIPAGENEGRTITYHNVVGDLKAIGVYKGQALSLTLPRAAMAGLPHDGIAVVVQQEGYGHVIGAAYVSRPDYYAQQ